MAVLTQQQRETFHENGFLIVRRMVDPELVKTLRSAATRLLKSDLAAASSRTWLDYPDGQRISLLEQPGRFSREISAYQQQPEIAQAAAELLGVNRTELVYDLLENIEPSRGAGMPFHQDGHRFGYLATASSLTTWSAMANTVTRSGCLQIVPGSHRWGRINCPGWSIENPEPDYLIENCLDEAQRRQAVPVAAEMEASDVLFIHSLALRGSHPNTTSSDRIALVQLFRG